MNARVVKGRARLWPLLLIAGTGCSEAPADDQKSEIPLPVASSPCTSESFEGSQFTVCRFDSRKQELQLRSKNSDGLPFRNFEALEAGLGGDVGRLSFAMNAGMYDEVGDPIGLYVEDGSEKRKLNQRDGPGNFHLKPNGVFAVDGKGQVSVTSAARFGKQVKDVKWATQSGPMLVIDGKLHAKFTADGQSRYVRNGVGVRDPGTAFFVISEDAVSFGRFARFFRDILKCPNALYLDGSVSSLWDPASGRMDAYSQLGPMFVVFDRRATSEVR